MYKSDKLLLDIVPFRTYAHFLAHLSRRETLEETINRNMNMHLQKFGSLSKQLSKDIIKAYGKVHDLKLMPSMRGMQFAGEAILKNNARQYNCSFLPIDDIKAFGETLFLLLSGVGVGFSVQKRHISKLHKIRKPSEEGRYEVHDSIIGWAKAVDELFEAYMYGRIRPQFDFSKIRPKGSYLVTTGAKAPGPEPLRKMLEQVESRLKKSMGRKLTSLEVHDIICIISDCVLSGGIRRAALISLFDRDDNEMLLSKSGEWWTEHPYRARANNSAVLPRDISFNEFREIFDVTKKSGSGEPGFAWTNNFDFGGNPCYEISLEANQFCNLCTVNVGNLKSKKDFLSRVHSATILGTLQAAYTDFPYLRPRWKETTERASLIGVSMTGIADMGGKLPATWLQEGAKLVKDINEKYAKKIDINPAHRLTTIKPEGSSSCVFGTSSGVHDRYSNFYFRRVRMNKDDALYKYLEEAIPELCEDDLFSPNGGIITIPQSSPKGAVTREDTTAIDLLKRAMFLNRNWIAPGHVEGDNKNNVSLTVSVKDNEWDEVADFMYKNKHLYSGISLLPYDGGTYKQAPFEEITEETFFKYENMIENVDLREVREDGDYTNKTETIACSGGACEII